MTEKNKRKTVTAVILIASVLLVFVVAAVYFILSTKVKSSENEYRLYYISEGSDSLIGFEKRMILRDENVSSFPKQLLSALLEGPVSSDLTSPFPEGLQVNSVSVEAGILYVDLNDRYASLDAYRRNLADCCLFHTAAELDGIYGLQITVDGSPLYDGVPLTKQRFITSDSFFHSYSTEFKLYYPSEDFSGLYSYRYPATLYADFTDAETIVYLLTEQIFPSQPYAPFSSRLFHSVKTAADVVYVDLSADILLQDNAAVSEDGLSEAEQAGEMYLHAIVYSLTELDHVNEVVFTFDGETVASYADLDLSRPVQRYDTVPVY